jgi:ParB family chromosome partitioning protein
VEVTAMAKREFAKIINSSINIAASGSVADSITMIDIDNLKESPDNFFEVNRVEELADTILGQGYVKENLIVRQIEGIEYEIISGHRRTAAVRLLIERGESISRKLPCLVQTYESEDHKNLDIVFMNTSARRISDAELFKSYEIVNSSLQNLKLEGVKFGQTQKTLAEILGISTGHTAKLQIIDKYATDEVKEAVEKGEISINKAADKVNKFDNKPKKQVKPKSDKKDYKSEKEKVTNLDNFSEDEVEKSPKNLNNDKLYTNEELAILWSNSEKRRAFTEKYKEWGIYAQTAELNLTYYKYDLPGGSRLIVMEHMQKYNPFSDEWEISTMKYLQKYEYFMPHNVSDYDIDEHLKELKGEL